MPTAPIDSAVELEPVVNMARQALYRFAALSLLDPRAEARERLAQIREHPLLDEAAAVLRDLREAVPPTRSPLERPLADLDPLRVLERLPDSDGEHSAHYERTFGLLVSNACPPYEMEYIPEKLTFQRSNMLADINGYYRAFGLAISEQNPDRPDHVVLELEFMAFLIGREREAGEADDPSRREEWAAICRAAQARFLREHLAWWTPAFARLLDHEDPGGFYAAAGEFLAALIPAERGVLGVETVARPTAPSSAERPEACEGCELAT
ncbi:MAG: molecular chaperone TorD family protein [Planctomycetales bacterium]